MKSKVSRNGVELMQKLLASIRNTAPLNKIRKIDKDVIVFLRGGLNDGHAVRLYQHSDGMSIGFHTFENGALASEDEIRPFFEITLFLEQTSVSDPKKGHLLGQKFHTRSQLGDLLLLTSECTKFLPFLQTFLGMLEGLPCHYAWEDELKLAKQKIQAEYEEPLTPAVSTAHG